eukprot:maker-scaffold_19-snap-gene-4.40-mRNA-1 protein AED:0.03 eAED:0.03 QI:52/1/1/1/0.5/0.2/5/35/497
MEKIEKYIEKQWNENCIPQIEEYIKIPNLSPYFDKDVLTNGHMDKAMDLIKTWVEAQEIKGAKIHFSEKDIENNKTPFLFIEVDAFNSNPEDTGTVLLYGHMDKQPPFNGWDEEKGLGPYEPKIFDGKLYGRGGADDGYSAFCAVLAIKSLQEHNLSHGRLVILIEACEESGSPDLEFYVQKYLDKIKQPNLVICLDSGCGNYEQLWITDSLRGVIGGNLSVSTLTEGVHSGDASGVVPGTTRILRQLLDRLEDSSTGKVIPEDFYVEISQARKEQIEAAANVLVDGIKVREMGSFPLVGETQLVSDDPVELCLNRWWRPQLVLTGQSGLPDCSKAGSVLRPNTTFTLSLRLPPGVDAKEASQKLKDLLLKDPPYNADVSFDGEKAASGWAAPEKTEWLMNSLEFASETVFKKKVMFQGEGGTIPFMAMLGNMFPKAQFCVTGVLGPESNPHGPNEFLHIDFSRKLTNCVAIILQKHCEAKVEQLIQEPEKKKQKKQ